MRTFSSAGVHVDTLDGEAALRLTADPSARLDAANAERVLAAIAANVARKGALDVLVDARHAGTLTLDGALPWMGALQKHRGNLRLHVYAVPFALRALLLVAQTCCAGAIEVHPDEASALEALRRRRVPIAPSGPSPS